MNNKTQEGDAIWVAKETYSPGTGKTDTFILKKVVKVYGGFAGTEANLDDRNWVTNKTSLSGKIDECTNVYHVVTGESDATPDDTLLDGFTVTGGNANGPTDDERRGGGMFNKNSSPTVENCTFSGNTAIYGDGIFNGSNSSPTVTNCSFSSNTANHGGGMYSISDANPTLANTILWGNTAANDSNGQDIHQDGSTLPLKNCVDDVDNKCYFETIRQGMNRTSSILIPS